MADHSKIEWTETTWNPIAGCTHVSPGCDNCYAAREASGRLSCTPTYAGLASGGKFNGTVRLRPERLDQPLRWRKPRRVFVNSMSDLFHDGVPDEFIARVWQTMAATPRHTYQILTKRHARMRSWVHRWYSGEIPEPYDSRTAPAPVARPPARSVLDCVWLGVSVETQQWADIRIPALLDTPAAVRWVSCEPLLGPVHLTRWLRPWPGYCQTCGAELDPPAAAACASCGLADADDGTAAQRRFARPDWVVVGGESGPGARLMYPGWARSLVGQCRAAGVPAFVKQMGQVWAAEHGGPKKGGDVEYWPADLRVREYPAAVTHAL